MLGNRGKLHPGTWGASGGSVAAKPCLSYALWVFETQTLRGHLLEKQTEPSVWASSSSEHLIGCFLLETSIRGEYAEN